MKCKLLSVFLFTLYELVFYAASSHGLTTFGKPQNSNTNFNTNNGFVVSRRPFTTELEPTTDTNSSRIIPQIYSMQIHTNISNRFARTLITSKVRNLMNKTEETTFSVILPENAFISSFEMEIDGTVYKAYVKEKEEARKIYQQAVFNGQSAAHVWLSARGSKTFTISVNIEPEAKTIFRLIYEELLQRQSGQYELIINIHPGQPVEDLGVKVHISESRRLTFVKTPSLRTGNEISKNDKKLNPSAEIKTLNSTAAIVKFSPNITEQKTFAETLGGKKENGVAGQFVVQYDVERDPQGGEVLVQDGYFVHFFAPSELSPLPKHVVFVLDHSASMSGRKIDQLIEAMQNILSELKTEDLFNIVRFSSDASVWNVAENNFDTVHLNSLLYGHLKPRLKELNLPEAVKATKENVEKAKNAVKNKTFMETTNIIAGLEVGLFLIKRTQENIAKKYQPMLMFLTDGLSNVGIHRGDHITDIVTWLNSEPNRAAIFSLSFGDDADKDFLRKLSSKNLGFSRHIYEAADAALQLQTFYHEISSPMLSNITFKYSDGVSALTESYFPLLFKGSELVVAGKTGDNPDILLHVNGLGTKGPVVFNTIQTKPVSSLERLWAYLTVKQILNERETATNKSELTQKALDLALKYSFVTSVSSLVVVKPNQTEPIDTVSDTETNVYFPRTRAGTTSGWSTLTNQHIPRGGGGLTLYGKPNRQQDYFTAVGPVPSPSTNTTLSPLEKWQQNYYTTAAGPVPPQSTSSQGLNIPHWLEILKDNNENITTPEGLFKLGKRSDATSHSKCSNTPVNETTGFCTVIFDCPKVFFLLTHINVYLKYFCLLNEYAAGICCPT